MATNMRARYSRAVHSGNLTVVRGESHEEVLLNDPEVLGAYGLADRNLTAGRERGRDGKERPVTPAPLAVPLERLFAGDARAAHEVVRILADAAFNEARRRRVKLDQVQAFDMARAVLAWFRNGVCRPCGGRGFPIIKDSPVQSVVACEHCAGIGKVPLLKHFRYEWKPIVTWLKDRIDDESGRASSAAMRTLAGN